MSHAALRVRLFVPLFVMIVLATGSAGAAGIGEPAPASDSIDLQPLTVGIMPAVDSGPLIVALSEGYFADEGLEVSLQLFRDQLYREAALQSGAIDAAVTDLVNAIRLWDNGAGSRVITSTQGVFSIVAGPGSGISSSSDWPELPDRVQTGSLEDSIINYVALRMLEHLGLEPQTLTVVPVLQIPLRVEMVVADQLDAVVLPEPVTRLATAGGAREILRSDILDWTPGVVLATEAALADKPAELAALVRGYDRAVAALSSTPDAYRTAIAEYAGFPPQVVDAMIVPRYLPATVPTSEQIADVAGWMIGRGMLQEVPQANQIVADLSGE